MNLLHHIKLGIAIMLIYAEFVWIRRNIELEVMKCRLKDAEGKNRSWNFRYGIAKFSQGLRKFRNGSENFAIDIIFAMIGKFRYHSENYCA